MFFEEKVHPWFGGTSGRRCLAFSTLMIALLCTGCKIVIVVPPGGKVISANGEECLSGQTCIIEVSDTSYDDRFIAMADDDYMFLGWKERDRGLCGGSWHSCRLYTSVVAGNAKLEAVLYSDTELYLEPVFARKTRYAVDLWAALLDDLDEKRFASDDFLYAVLPDIGGCDPGVLAEDARLRFWQAVNLVRALHELPPVDYDSGFDSQMQQASLVQEANNYLTHFPATTARCYTAAAAIGSETSNLSGGGVQVDPVEHILGWTNDNRNASRLMAAGHRRWALFPELGYTSFGAVFSSAAMKVFGFNRAPRLLPSADLEYVAFPYRDYPYIVVEQGSHPTPWSLSIVPPAGVSSQFDHFSQASVVVRDDLSGAELVVHSQYFDTDRFGLANFFSWMVEGWEYDRDYTVTVSGVRMPGGDVQVIEYPVRLDRFNLLNIDKPLEKGDAKVNDVISGTFSSGVDKDSYSLQLSSGLTSFRLQSGQFQGGFFVLIYDSEKRLIASADQAFGMEFPAGSYTLMVSPCDTDGLCYIGVEEYSVTIQ